MYRFVGWLLLLPLAGAFWLVMYIAKACVKKGGGLWRLLGVIAALTIGGVCAIAGYSAGTEGGLVAGWIALVVGVIIAALGTWTALKQTGEEIELVEWRERGEQLEKEIKELDKDLMPADKKLEKLLIDLYSVGKLKNMLPSNQRDWCDCLGLNVQLNEADGKARLQAREKDIAYIDAWSETPQTWSMSNWKVKTYNSGDWEKLIFPTYAIASWLSAYGGLPKEYEDAFNKAIEVFRKEGRLELPNVTMKGRRGV